jgi:CxxC motif-containing protein (DUF1111 family)
MTGTKCSGCAVIIAISASISYAQIQPRAGQPVSGLTTEQLERFAAGKTEFNRNLEAEDGLGPVFNDTSCGICHVLGGAGTTTVTRFGGMTMGGEFDPLAELGGSLLQDDAIFVKGVDCTESLPKDITAFALRLTNSTFGAGLVEAIDDQDIIDIALNQPRGLSGTVHMVEAFEDPKGSPLRVGRMGWKAQVATVLTFSADAALNEMGLTNRFVTEENAPNGDEAVLALCDMVEDPEDGPDKEGFHFIDRVTDFQRFLAPPPQTPKSGMTGEDIFVTIGCADCHVPEFITGDAPEESLANKVIKPYSDFLLHDMGELGDGIVQGAGTEQLMRTPSLWGLALRSDLLHDGRFAAGFLSDRLTMTIEEHDGEAEPSVMNWLELTADDKGLVIDFLASLGRPEFDFPGPDGAPDNDVDLTDFAEFQLCFTGPGPAYTPDDLCAIADFDQDGDVDLNDFNNFQLAFTGPNPDIPSGE